MANYIKLFLNVHVQSRYPAEQLGLNCRLSYFVYASSEGPSKSVHICADFLEGSIVTDTVNLKISIIICSRPN